MAARGRVRLLSALSAHTHVTGHVTPCMHPSGGAQASVDGFMEELGVPEAQAQALVRRAADLAAEARDAFVAEREAQQQMLRDPATAATAATAGVGPTTHPSAGRMRPLVAFSCGSYGGYLAGVGLARPGGHVGRGVSTAGCGRAALGRPLGHPPIHPGDGARALAPCPKPRKAGSPSPGLVPRGIPHPPGLVPRPPMGLVPRHPPGPGRRAASTTGARASAYPGARTSAYPGLAPRPTPGLVPRPTPGLVPRPTPGPVPRHPPGPGRRSASTGLVPRLGHASLSLSLRPCYPSTLLHAPSDSSTLLHAPGDPFTLLHAPTCPAKPWLRARLAQGLRVIGV